MSIQKQVQIICAQNHSIFSTPTLTLLVLVLDFGLFFFLTNSAACKIRYLSYTSLSVVFVCRKSIYTVNKCKSSCCKPVCSCSFLVKCCIERALICRNAGPMFRIKLKPRIRSHLVICIGRSWMVKSGRCNQLPPSGFQL